VAARPRHRGTIAALTDAIDAIERALAAAMPPDGSWALDGLLATVRAGQPGEPALDALGRRVVRSTLEQLCTRQAEDAASPERYGMSTSRTSIGSVRSAT
jgi:hypothetical protein